MVLYFPVSALVTLFGHILQNPLDPRAKSDTKLMNVVVNFLSMLGHEAETGGVHRMLGVCSEFDRIAKVVIEKAEKDHASRRKRKNNPDQSATKPAANSADSPSFNPNPIPPTSRPATASSATPQPSGSYATNQRHLSPPTNDRRSPQNPNNNGSPMTGTISQSPSPGLAPTGWHSEFTPDSSEYNSYADMGPFGAMDAMAAAGLGPRGGIASPPLTGPGGGAGPGSVFYQQPMLPQDLFSLPMTLDWNWAEMSGGAYPSVENGAFGGGGMDHMDQGEDGGPGQHHQRQGHGQVQHQGPGPHVR